MIMKKIYFKRVGRKKLMRLEFYDTLCETNPNTYYYQKNR